MGEPRERPILFSGPMTRAILEGRKTQTRRVVAGQRALAPGVTQFPLGGLAAWVANDSAVREEAARLLPRIERGDRLWVRETWFDDGTGDRRHVDYRATHECRSYEAGCPCNISGDGKRSGWRPSIHMPRWAARITLAVTSVRVERLQDISEEDARAEWVEKVRVWDESDELEHDRDCSYAPPLSSHVGAFQLLWDSINGKRIGCAWSDNPWVWVVGFERRT